MHELSIAMGIVEGVLEEAERHGAKNVEAVHVRLGRLSGVDKDALLFSYNLACEETPLAHSRLVIEDLEVVVLCPLCRAERPAQSFPSLLCADCGSPGRLIHGQELEIRGLEIAT
jgi:hydrogenase nickel incorporation protein HypA/HybF